MMPSARKSDLSRDIAVLDQRENTRYDYGKIVQETLDDVLKSKLKYRISGYRTIATDPKVRAMMSNRFNYLQSVPFVIDVDPSIDEAQAGELREHCMKQLSMIDNFKNSLRSMQRAILYGFKVGELVWVQNPDGSYWVKRIRVKDSEYFEFGVNGELLFRPSHSHAPVELDEKYKFLVYTHDEEDGNRKGQGIGESLFWPVTIKRLMTKHWAIIGEKYAMPVPVAVADVSKAQADTIRDALNDLVNQTVLVLSGDPDKIKLEFLQPQSNVGSDVFAGLISYCDRQIVTLIAGESVSSGEDLSSGKGSQALGNVSREISVTNIEADASDMAALITQLLRWNIELNYGEDIAEKITLRYDFEEDETTVNEKGLILWRLGMTVPGMEISERHLREVYDLPAPENDNDVIIVGDAGGGQQAQGLPFSDGGSGQVLFADDTTKALTVPDYLQRVGMSAAGIARDDAERFFRLPLNGLKKKLHEKSKRRLIG